MRIIDLKSSCKNPYTPPTKFSWKGVSHAYWSNRIFTSHGAFTHANISVLCNSVSKKLQGKELHLPRSISYAKLLIDLEMANRIERLLAGIDVIDEGLALDTNHDVGPGGNFLESEHTLKHMRNILQPDLMKERDKGTISKAYARAIYLLENHIPLPLPEASKETMRLIIHSFLVYQTIFNRFLSKMICSEY